MRTTLLAIITIFSLSANAQNKAGTIKGSIYDSINDYALQSASVTIYKQADSSMASFQLTNTLGEFEIKELPVKTALQLVITNTGYRPLIRNFRLDSSNTVMDFKKLAMQQKKSGELEEAFVKVVQPLRLNGDTLEINPNAFKLDSNAVVEDMLLRVPGLTVWGDGTITMNGRKIENVYVDGKPFFGGAAQTATQNLPKNAIEKIQIYQEKDLSKQNNMDEKKDSLYSMNIKLKEDKKKGIFGKIGAGYGTDDHYTGDGVLQAYDKKNQYGIAAGINNINKEEGTGENAFSDNTFKSNFRIYYGGRGGASGGITRRTYANLKWQHSFSESDNSQLYNRITTDYGFLNTLTNISSDITTTDTRNNSRLTSTGSNRNINDNSSSNFKMLYENRKKFGNFVNFNVNYTHQQGNTEASGTTRYLRNDSTNVSNIQNSSQGNTNNDNLNFFGWIRSNDYELKRDPRKNFGIFFNGNYSGSQNDRSIYNKQETFEGTPHTDIIDRKYSTRNNNYNIGINLNYDGFRPLLFGIYNFHKIDIALQNRFSFARNQVNTQAADRDSITHQYTGNSDLTYINTQSTFTYEPGLNFSRSFSKSVWGKHSYWLYSGLQLTQRFINQKNESTILNRNIAQNVSLFTPNANLSFNYTKENAFRINSFSWGGINTVLPTIDQLYPIVDNSSRYNVIVGNPNLKTGKSHYLNFNIDINRSKLNTKTTYGMSLGINATGTTRAVGDSLVYAPGDTASTRYLINVPRQQAINGSVGLNLSTTFNKKNTIAFHYNGSVNSSNRPGYIDGQYAVSKNNTLTHTFTTQYNLLDKFNISLGETISNYKNLQGGSKGLPAVLKNYTTTSNLNYFITKSITFNTSLNYQYNTASNNDQAKAAIWNATGTWRFMQQKAELKFSAFDLLRQNKNITNFLSTNTASTTITNGLQQYFMVTFSYFPRKFGGNKVAPPPPGGIMIIR